MNREERRKYGKISKSNKPSQVPLNVLSYSDQQVADSTGVKLSQLKTYLSAREEEMRKAATLQAQEKFWKAEDYIAVANILISIYAIKMSRKGREHTVDLIRRMLDNLNSAKEYVERTGIEKAYEYAHTDLGISLEFDSMDLNKEFGFDEFDFREEGFEGRSSYEVWNAAWEDAKDLSNIINTCSACITLKRRFGFSNSDIQKLIKESNVRSETAKEKEHGVTDLINEFEQIAGLSISERNKNLVKRYDL